MKKFLLLALLAVVSNAFAQNWPVKQLVTDKKQSGKTFPVIPAFRFTGSKQLEQRGTYQELRLEAAFTRQIMQQKPEALTLKIPLSATETIICELVKASLGNIKFTENNDQVIPNVRIPVLYRGIVAGEQQKNMVILTVNDDYLSLMATFTNKTIQISQADTASQAMYRLYNSTGVQFPAAEFNCGTKETAATQTAGSVPLNSTYNKNNTAQDKCVNVYVDCFDSLYLHFGSSRQLTLNYVHELFNLVTTGYLNDDINIQVIGINLWTTPDPYRQDSSGIALNDLGFHYQDNFWGNICVGLDWGLGRGGLAWLGRAKAATPNSCGVYRSADSSGAFSYCDLNFSGNFQNFPTGQSTTPGQVKVTMHEIGHALGSQHTHWCGWQLTPTTTGPIDNCAPVDSVAPNGPCAPGPPPPANGGTIMSYCNRITGGFVNYNNGFGPLPRNAIHNFISGNRCISDCMFCLIGKAGGKKRLDDNSPLSQKHLLPYQTKPPLRPTPPDANQKIAFSASAVRTINPSRTAVAFRKPDVANLRPATPATTR